MGAHLLGAERAIEPDRERRGMRTEIQNASGVWPDSMRPDRSVMVPETMTGTRNRAPRTASAMAQTAPPWH
jgi:hypothetical protein